MARRILIVGMPGGSHYNEVLSGVLMGYFSARSIGEMTFVGQDSKPEKKTTRITLSNFPWENLPEYDVLVTLSQTGSYSYIRDDKGLQHFTFPQSPDNMTDTQVKTITEFVRKGKGCVAIHTACMRFNKEFNDMIGGSFIKHPSIHEFTIEVVDHKHPITQGMESFSTVDELFFTEHDIHAIQVLLYASYEGKKSPMAWVKSYGGGRVAYIALGHDLRTFLNPSFLKLVERSTLWATRDI